MQFQLPTYNKGVKLYFSFRSKTPIPLRLQGYDSVRPNTYYFDREVEVNGKKDVDVALPISPTTLTVTASNGGDVTLFNYEEGALYDISKIKHKRIGGNPSNRFSGRDREFVDFVLWFSENAGVLPTGEYESKRGRFKIIYLPDLPNTPARIQKDTGIIEVSKDDFLPKTVPNRVFKLLHEYSHLYKNRNKASEIESDNHAVRMFKRIGFPKVEAVYAITELEDTGHPQDYNWARMMNVYNKL